MRQELEHNKISTTGYWAKVLLLLGILLLLLAAVCAAAIASSEFMLSDADKANDHAAMRMSLLAVILILPLAAFGGLLTILGLVFRKPNSGKKRDDLKLCPSCGRENAVTTEVCPRCELRLE